MTADRTKMGGAPVLRLAHLGRPGTTALVEGAGPGERNLAATLSERFGGRFKLEAREVSTGTDWLPEPDAVVALDVVLLAAEDLLDPSLLPAGASAARIHEHGREMVRRIDAWVSSVKAQDGPHVMVTTGSTAHTGHQLRRRPGRPSAHTLLTLAFNLETLRLSRVQGISFIDVDRTTGEMGTNVHVVGPYAYTPEAREAIRGEIVRVLEDVGFFEDRPLVPQVGAAGGK